MVGTIIMGAAASPPRCTDRTLTKRMLIWASQADAETGVRLEGYLRVTN